MSLIDKFFNKRTPQPVQLPALLEPEDPVNFDSVVDWMIGLSEAERKQVDQVITIYRDANTKAAEALGVPEKPTTFIKPKKLTSKQIDEGLDGLLDTHPADLRASLEADSHDTPASNQQRKITKKVTIK